MIELFTNIPEPIKIQAKLIADLALSLPRLIDGVKVLAEYAKTCQNEEERKFVDFYFNMRLEQLENENNNN